MTHFLIHFIFHGFQPRSFHGSNLALHPLHICSLPGELTGSILSLLFPRLRNNFALFSSIKCQNVNGSSPICYLLWMPVPFSHSQLVHNILTSSLCMFTVYFSAWVLPNLSLSFLSIVLTAQLLKRSLMAAGLTVGFFFVCSKCLIT